MEDEEQCFYFIPKAYGRYAFIHQPPEKKSLITLVTTAIRQRS